MKTITQQHTYKYRQSFNSYFAPMFKPVVMEQPMAKEAATQSQIEEKQQKLSVFDVKELYDLAYDEKAAGCDDARFKAILAEAVKLDMEYRRQLAEKVSYKDMQKQKSFTEASTGTQAA